MSTLPVALEVFMVGCPNGLFVESERLPIVRKGILANKMSEDFSSPCMSNVGVVDIACFPGSSGSVILADRDFLDEPSQNSSVAPSRMRLCGILSSGPTFNRVGAPIPKGGAPTRQMMHIGYFVKGFRIAEMMLRGTELLTARPPPHDNLSLVARGMSSLRSNGFHLSFLAIIKISLFFLALCAAFFVGSSQR